MLKRWILAMLVALATLGSLAATPAAARRSPGPGTAVNVQPVFRGSPGNTWPAVTYQAVKAKGFSTVRFVLFWDLMEPTPGGFDPQAFQTLDTAIARAKAARLKVVLDTIHLFKNETYVPAWARGGRANADVHAHGSDYVRYVARRYSREPAVIGYDLVNEPQGGSADDALRLYRRLIYVARTVNPNKRFIIEPVYGDSSTDHAHLHALHYRRNVIWSIHDYYAGGAGVGYQANGFQVPGHYTYDGTTGYNPANVIDLGRHFEHAIKRPRSWGLPIWVGEFSIGATAPGRDAFIRDKVATFKRHHVHYGWWELYTHGPLSAVDAGFKWNPWIDLLFAKPAPQPPPPTPTPTPTPKPVPGDQPTTAKPCGVSPSPAAWAHVVWIVFENKKYSDIIGNSAAPNLNSIAQRCGLATNFFAESHPSLPNYIAMTSGSTQGISDDSGPSSHQLNVPSIFSQLGAGGWRSLEESMPSNCSQGNSGDYAVRHNPAVYYTNIASQCASQDVPLGSTPDLSAKFTFITPNLCHDMHSSSCASDSAGEIKAGDSWIGGFINSVINTPQYQAGNTIVFLTWDEDDFSSNQHIATIVMSPSTPAGVQAGDQFNHYSMLRTTEEVLGLPAIAGAASAGSMRAGFHL